MIPGLNAEGNLAIFVDGSDFFHEVVEPFFLFQIDVLWVSAKIGDCCKPDLMVELGSFRVNG